MTYLTDDQEGDWLEERVEDEGYLNAEETMENSELGDAIYDCMSKLSVKQSTVFKMKTILGYETETICKELDITASNLWVILHRARIQLAECLEKKWL
jgi:RNA polymerase sigma-70 factor (ECF subfamily)